MKSCTPCLAFTVSEARKLLVPVSSHPLLLSRNHLPLQLCIQTIPPGFLSFKKYVVLGFAPIVCYFGSYVAVLRYRARWTWGIKSLIFAVMRIKNSVLYYTFVIAVILQAQREYRWFLVDIFSGHQKWWVMMASWKGLSVLRRTVEKQRSFDAQLVSNSISVIRISVPRYESYALHVFILFIIQQWE